MNIDIRHIDICRGIFLLKAAERLVDWHPEYIDVENDKHTATIYTVKGGILAEGTTTGVTWLEVRIRINVNNNETQVLDVGVRKDV